LCIELREAKLEDKVLLFKWFNSKDSLKFKIKTRNKIDFFNHEKWFKTKLKDKNTYIWIIEDSKSVPIGQIRFEYSKENFYDIDIFIIKKYRKKGIASLAIKKVEKIFKRRPLRAKVKKNNNFSLLFFIKNNFSLISESKEFWVLVKK